MNYKWLAKVLIRLVSLRATVDFAGAAKPLLRPNLPQSAQLEQGN